MSAGQKDMSKVYVKRYEKTERRVNDEKCDPTEKS